MLHHVASHPLRVVGTVASLTWSLASWGGVGAGVGIFAVVLLTVVFAVLFRKVGALAIETQSLSSSVSRLSEQVGKIEDGMGVARDE